MDIDLRTIIFGVLFIFLLYMLFVHSPDGGGHKGHDDKGGDKHGGKDAHHKK